MARAETASASLRSDSIKGLAQSIANPAYRRLLTAEPLLRRAVPVLIVAFMLTICIGAAVQVLEQRRQAILDEVRMIEALADHLSSELDRTARDGRPIIARNSESLSRIMPAWERDQAGAFSLPTATALSLREYRRTNCQRADGIFSMYWGRRNR